MPESSTPAQVRRSTFFGGAAILLWSTTVAFSRSLTEQLGTLTAASLIYLGAGLLGLAAIAFQANGWAALRILPGKYKFGCGALFVSYITTFYLAIGLSTTREQVLAVGLINYLWPALSLIFSIPILGRKARPVLPLGIGLALFGTWLATTGGQNVFAPEFEQQAYTSLPYALALAAAICWGLYSNLSRKWAAAHDGAGVPLFLLASGLLLGILRLGFKETSFWSTGSLFELLYMIAFPGMLAYAMWDIAVRRGEIILVASLSYLTPLLSTLFSTVILDVRGGDALWIGAALIVAGALICKYAILNEPPPAEVA
jgi:drug/metabolite transporter (DMT)-like permease